MHRSLHFVVAMQVLLFASCAAPMLRTKTPPPPPKIEGAAGSVSEKDIRQAIVLVEQSMRQEFGRTLPIDRVEVINRNDIFIHTSKGLYPVRCVHGVWTPPPPGIWVNP